MLREKEYIYNTLLGILDVCITLLSFFLAVYIRFGTDPIPFPNMYKTLGVLIVPVWYLLIRAFNLSKIHRAKSYAIVFLEYFMVVSVGMGIVFFSIYILDLNSASRLMLSVFAFLNFVALFTLKSIEITIFRYYRSKGYNPRNAVVVADDNSLDFIEKINDHTSWGYNILGIISDSPKLRAKFGDRFKFYPDKTHVWLLLEEEAIDELIYARKGFDNEEIKQLIFACEEIGVTFRMRSQLFTMVATKAHLNYFDEIPFLTFTNTPTDYMALLAKSVFDKLFALFAILLSSPVLILLMVLIKLDSKGPIFFIQKRVGLRGRIFGVYKFRTMVVNAEALKDQLMSQNEQQGPVFKMKKDPRITRVGRFLRKTSLDELPQFFNVLFGDMSVVGPRPPVPREVAQYERWQLRRLSMKPGITCIWQVSGRNEISFEEWMRLDLQYIDSWSLKLDVILIIKTIGVVLKADGH